MNLTGKAAIVTGGSMGIGRAAALTLGARGAKVAVNYCRHAPEAEATVAAIKQAGGEAFSVQADVRNFAEVQTMVGQTLDQFHRLDILVNNAGLIRDNFVALMRDEEWNEVLDTNLKGAFHCIKAVSREMIKQKWGRIINISSDAGRMGDLRRANYAAAKAGLIGMTKAVARELAPSGVCVNAIAPGIINTALIAKMPEATRARQLAAIPSGRFGEPGEVAELIAFLASEAAGYITGQVISIDGGLYM